MQLSIRLKGNWKFCGNRFDMYNTTMSTNENLWKLYPACTDIGEGTIYMEWKITEKNFKLDFLKTRFWSHTPFCFELPQFNLYHFQSKIKSNIKNDFNIIPIQNQLKVQAYQRRNLKTVVELVLLLVLHVMPLMPAIGTQV